MSKLLGRTLHVAFIISSPPDLSQHNDIHSVKIREEEYMMLIPKSNHLSESPSIKIRDLHGQTIIMPSESTLLNRQLSLLFRENGIAPEILCIIAQLAGECLAMGFASSGVAEKICPENCRIVPLAEKIYRTIYYVTLNELLDYPLTKAFHDFIAGH